MTVYLSRKATFRYAEAVPVQSVDDRSLAGVINTVLQVAL